MSESPKRSKLELALSILIIAVLLCNLLAFAVLNFGGFAQFCTTDMYEDTLVARLIWEQKTLFPSNYLFGNQFYVIATPVLAALLYGITGSMNLSMALATTVMSILILLSLNWMLKPFVRKAYLRYAALLTLVLSVYGPNTLIREDGQLFFVMCSFYACYLITFFYLMGDYARARESEDLRLPAFILALILSFCTGMQSLRQTCVSMLPILCFEFFLAFLRLIKKSPLWEKGKRMPLIRAGGYLAANAAGVIFIKLLGVQRNEIYYGQSIFSGASIRDKISDLHQAIITVSGYDFTRSGNEPFFIVLFLFLTLLLIAALFIILRRGDFTSAASSFWLICVISIMAVVAASFVTSVSLRPIYLFPYYTLPALSFVVVIGKLKPQLKNVLCVLICVLAFANIHYSYGEELEKTINPPENTFAQISDFAVANGFEYVYGSHSHTAPGIAAASDGKLIAGCWTDDIIFKVSPHINIKDIYHFDDYSKAIFVFLETEVPLAETEAEGNGTELTFLGQFGNFYAYSTSKQMLYPVSDNIHNFPEYN